MESLVSSGHRTTAVKEKYLKREKLSHLLVAGCFFLCVGSPPALSLTHLQKPDLPSHQKASSDPENKTVKKRHCIQCNLTQIRFHITSLWKQFTHLWLARPTRRWQISIWVLSTVRPPPGWRLVRIRALSCFCVPPWRRLIGVWSFSLHWLFPQRWLVGVWIVPVSPLCQWWPMRIRWTFFTW